MRGYCIVCGVGRYLIVWGALVEVNFNCLCLSLIELDQFGLVLLFQGYHIFMVKTFVHTLRCIKTLDDLAVFLPVRGALSTAFFLQTSHTEGLFQLERH